MCPLPSMGLGLCYFFRLECHSSAPHCLENSSSSFKTQPAFTSSVEPSLTLGRRGFLSAYATRLRGSALSQGTGVQAPLKDTDGTEDTCRVAAGQDGVHPMRGICVRIVCGVGVTEPSRAPRVSTVRSTRRGPAGHGAGPWSGRPRPLRQDSPGLPALQRRRCRCCVHGPAGAESSAGHFSSPLPQRCPPVPGALITVPERRAPAIRVSGEATARPWAGVRVKGESVQRLPRAVALPLLRAHGKGRATQPLLRSFCVAFTFQRTLGSDRCHHSAQRRGQRCGEGGSAAGLGWSPQSPSIHGS